MVSAATEVSVVSTLVLASLFLQAIVAEQTNSIAINFFITVFLRNLKVRKYWMRKKGFLKTGGGAV